jgi:hypothetical protein
MTIAVLILHRNGRFCTHSPGLGCQSKGANPDCDGGGSLWRSLLCIPFRCGAIFVWHIWCEPTFTRDLAIPFAQLSIGAFGEIFAYGLYS